MAKKHPPIIMFDLDGVLLNSRAHLLVAMQALTDSTNRWNHLVASTTTGLEVLRLVESGARARNYATIKAMMQNLVELIPSRISRILFLAKYNRTVNKIEWEYSHFFPGIGETLNKLAKKGIILGAATNSYGYRIKKWLELANLSHLIQFYTSRDDRKVLGSKPSPKPLFGLLVKMKRHYKWGRIDLNRVAFVGDNITDILAAKRARVKSIAVKSGHAYPEELSIMKPDFLLKDVNEIPSILNQLFPNMDD
ncbi:Phosphoglycolate phosphatase [Candidatus Lokiarchaeum ossiferum]|uniref:Phosphoglycolate phosphatase n=1 Tax=Candidatus Lokiarchaeum ossiferum TaxID=2951803 RepID=A0ABY6HX67_9ARCH|nr:Phosphoglycolate phosphatase [Candidatus Lokiarchaeum sp. B-35]